MRRGEDDNGDQNKEMEEEEDNDDEGEKEEEDNDLTNINCSAEFHYDNDLGTVTIISRHLIESHGKLLMVIHHRRLHPDHLHSDALWITLQVDVFEADFSTHAWVPLTGGLGGGQALFLSMECSKSVPAPCGEVEEDVIYFMDTNNVFNMKTGASSPSKICEHSGTTWLFPPELVP